jgi:elongation factor G
MEQFTLENIRNVSLLSHAGAGKTSLSESVLFNAKAITRLGRVDEGTTTSDYDPDEVQRKISINLTVLPYAWQGVKVNLLDAPGYSDFVGEVKSALRVSEGAVILIGSTSGVEVGTEQVWQYCEEAALPRLIFINKMDRENADFVKVSEDAQKRFPGKAVALQIPIGAYTTFTGVVDLLKMRAYTGAAATEGAIPADMKASADSYRAKLVEAVASADDKLIEKYLNDEAISQEELENALKASVLSCKLVPIFTGSALQNIGITLFMDAIKHYLPSPKERQYEIVTDAKGTLQKVSASATDPLAALVFKTSADPYVGKLTYFRVYAGAFASNSQVWNSNRNEVERIGQVYLMRGKTQEAVHSVTAGDIGVVAKLNTTGTGDTLATKEKPVKLAPIVFPTPIYSGAVSPKTKADLDKLGSSLTRLAEEDPTIKVHREIDTGEQILSGLGETQLEVVVGKMQRKFGVGVTLDVPKVPYKETITGTGKGDYKHKKQTGGHGQYGHVMLEVEPMPRGTGAVEFEDITVGGTIPRNFIPAVEKGVKEGIKEGTVAGYPVVDVKAKVYDGSFHPVDSSEICFKIAGAGAFKKAMEGASPVLLEPIVKLKVIVPDNYTGDIMSDLNNKRGRVHGMLPEGGYNTIEAEVPLSEVQRYAIDLKSITQGRGRYTFVFSHMEEVPAFAAQKIAAARKAELEAKAAEKE